MIDGDEPIEVIDNRYALTKIELRKLQHCCDMYVFLLNEGYSKEHANKIFESQWMWETKFIRSRLTSEYAILQSEPRSDSDSYNSRAFRAMTQLPNNVY